MRFWKNILLILLFTTHLSCYEPDVQDLSRAHSFFVMGNYKNALDGYKAIVYYFVAPHFTLEQVKQQVPEEQMNLFCDALMGKLETEKKLGIINLSDEAEILDAINPYAASI